MKKKVEMPKDVIDQFREWGREGGKKGGSAGGKIGGKRRKKALTKKQLSEIARKAANARWDAARAAKKGNS